jgi:glycosyltransferase involved in cell wall biosynthesis
MQKCNILVLTSPKSNAYHGSPIKAIEYAATGNPILAARSTANEGVFTGGVTPFWYTPGDIENMHAAVVQILKCDDRELEGKKMRAFAESRTWRARTKKVLDQVEHNRKDIRPTREKD